MLSPELPDQALINARDRWPDCNCQAVGGFVGQMAGKVLALPTKEARRELIGSLPPEYKQAVKDEVLTMWSFR